MRLAAQLTPDTLGGMTAITLAITDLIIITAPTSTPTITPTTMGATVITRDITVMVITTAMAIKAITRDITTMVITGAMATMAIRKDTVVAVITEVTAITATPGDMVAAGAIPEVSAMAAVMATVLMADANKEYKCCGSAMSAFGNAQRLQDEIMKLLRISACS